MFIIFYLQNIPLSTLNLNSDYVLENMDSIEVDSSQEATHFFERGASFLENAVSKMKNMKK